MGQPTTGKSNVIPQASHRCAAVHHDGRNARPRLVQLGYKVHHSVHAWKSVVVAKLGSTSHSPMFYNLAQSQRVTTSSRPGRTFSLPRHDLDHHNTCSACLYPTFGPGGEVDLLSCLQSNRADANTDRGLKPVFLCATGLGQ